LTKRDCIISDERKAAVAKAIGTWSFSAHDFADDELIYCAQLMLEHALALPELENWRLSSGTMHPPMFTKFNI